VPEPTLDDDQWDAFAGHLDGVRAMKLMRREAPARSTTTSARSRRVQTGAAVPHDRDRLRTVGGRISLTLVARRPPGVSHVDVEPSRSQRVPQDSRRPRSTSWVQADPRRIRTGQWRVGR
jgi:hypothetical protein